MTDQTTPSRRAGLHDEIVKALGRIKTIPPVAHRQEQADHVLTVLYREWPWLRAEAEEAAPAGPAPATDRAGLRDRIAALFRTPPGAERLGDATPGEIADALLPVLPAPADRAAVLREAADECDTAGAAYTARALNDHAGGAFALMETFLRKANEAEYVATPCDFAGCEPGGEPCSTHERLMAHAEGDHELCAPECRTPDAELRRLAVEAQQPVPWGVCPNCRATAGPDCDCPPATDAVEDCTCIPFTRQGGVQRYCQPGDTVDMISGWEIGGDCPHHRDTVKAQPEQTAIEARFAALKECICTPDACPPHCPCHADEQPAVEAQQPKEARP